MSNRNSEQQPAALEPAAILIVDDEPAGRETLAALLRSYRLAFACDGAEALARAAAAPPDLILLDVMMPQMDGFEVCRRLRADPLLADVPILLVTALDDRDSRLAGIEAGADDFISKPFDRAELRARVRTITRLNRYRHLLTERARLARVIDLAPDSMMIMDRAGTIVRANPAAARLLDLPAPGDLIGRPLASFVVPELRAECVACLESVVDAPGATARIETVFASAGQRRAPVELHAGQLAWDERPAVQLIARDISDRKRAELLEEERHQIAYDLHDGLAQVVTSTHQHLQSYAARHRPRSTQTRAELERALDLARRAVREVRRVIAGLRPTALDDFGLAIALGMHVDSLRADGWEFSYEENLGGERLPTAIETVVFRVAQEALTNVRKHAQTRRAHVRLDRTLNLLRLVVQDWGQGFDPDLRPAADRPGERIGLRGMRERVALLSGSWRVESGPGSGATVIAEIPLKEQ